MNMSSMGFSGDQLNPLQAGMDQAGGTLQLPNVQDIQAPQVAAPQPLMTPEFLAQREADRGGPGVPQARGKFRPTGGGGFAFEADVPIPADREPGFIPTKESIAPLFATGTPAFANTGRGAPAPTPLAQPPAGELGAVAQAAPSQPSSPAMDGSQIPQFGEEGFQFAERGSPQDFFLSQTKDGTQSLSQEQIERGQSFAQQKGMNFDPTTGFSVGEQPPVSQGLTTQGGQPLAEFFAGGQQLDPQGRMIDPSVDRSFFEQESAAREQRAAEQFGVPRGPDSRDRDETGRISFEEARRRVPTERDARGNITNKAEQRAAMVKPEPEKDTRTPERIEQEKLANERTRQIIEAGNKPEATGFQKGLAKQEEQWQSAADAGILEDWEVDAQRKDHYKKPAPAGYTSWVEYEAEKRGEPTPSGEGVAATAKDTSDSESGDVLMIGTDGKTRKVPAKDKEAALKAGYTLK
jgi:hypothetical protein